MALPRSGPVRSEAAHRSILRATADLMAERGYAQLSMEGIAARAGVGKQTIYRWWPSKGAIIAECLLEGLLVSDRLRLPNTGDVRTDLRGWIESVFALLADEQGEGILRSLVAAAADNADVGQRLRDSLTGSESISGRLAAAIGETPNLQPGAPLDEIAEALIGGIILRALSRAPMRPGDADRILDAVLGR